jgi:hypothetical protein
MRFLAAAGVAANRAFAERPIATNRLAGMPSDIMPPEQQNL